jgi:hypothetical protein
VDETEGVRAASGKPASAFEERPTTVQVKWIG